MTSTADKIDHLMRIASTMALIWIAGMLTHIYFTLELLVKP